MPNTVIFISDIHLSEQNPALYELFIQFIQGPARTAKQLYILGDLFDVWVGKDIQSAFQEKILNALNTLSSHGVEIFFMHGNRDFLIPQSLFKNTVKIIPDPCVINLHGTPTLLTHGDLLCTQDVAYQRFRKIARNPLVCFIFRHLPKRKRENISQKLRKKSKEYQKTQQENILDVTQSAVENMMKKYQVKQLIHGHVHRPNIHEGKRFVLGDWHTNGSALISTPSEISLVSFNPIDNLTVHCRTKCNNT